MEDQRPVYTDASPGSQILNEINANPSLAIDKYGLTSYLPGQVDKLIKENDLLNDSDTGQSIGSDSGKSNYEKAFAVLNSNLSDSTKEYLAQYFLNEQSNTNAWNRQMQASNTQYQRTVADLKAAGLNPFLALDSLRGSSPASNGQSVSGGSIVGSKKNSMTKESAIIAVLGLLASSFVSLIGKMV